MTSARAATATGTIRQQPYDPCPVSPLVDVVFSRWTTPILWLLQHQGPMRFNELRERLGTITAKTLTERLRQLERDGLLIRTHHPQVPPRVDYEITDLGLSLSPIFRLMVEWSDDNMPLVRRAQRRYDDSGRPRPS
ncbi:winged helix-turn-helix transcriptional regulator [Streptomyces sp. RPT161]|uniref:winged helix-turn-helix transcriptional regulator n=1 Tax=Streptomyces sp. RPT161 TaxID=3015993 RepID=UPI0022B85A32|nr:helix-turn-helix domain-containing protein [Streptomyces sp. RPT161]